MANEGGAIQDRDRFQFGPEPGLDNEDIPTRPRLRVLSRAQPASLPRGWGGGFQTGFRRWLVIGGVVAFVLLDIFLLVRAFGSPAEAPPVDAQEGQLDLAPDVDADRATGGRAEFDIPTLTQRQINRLEPKEEEKEPRGGGSSNTNQAPPSTGGSTDPDPDPPTQPSPPPPPPPDDDDGGGGTDGGGGGSGDGDSGDGGGSGGGGGG